MAESLTRETTAKKALAETNAKLTRSRAAVEARYDLAVKAIRTYHTGVSQDFLLKQGQFKELRHELMRSASDYYGKLGTLLARENDVASRRALVASNFDLALLNAGSASRRGPGGAPGGAGLAGGIGRHGEIRPRFDGRRRPEPDRDRQPARGNRQDRGGDGGLAAVGVAARGPGGFVPVGAGPTGGLPDAAGRVLVKTGRTERHSRSFGRRGPTRRCWRRTRRRTRRRVSTPASPGEPVNRIGVLLSAIGRQRRPRPRAGRRWCSTREVVEDAPADPANSRSFLRKATSDSAFCCRERAGRRRRRPSTAGPLRSFGAGPGLFRRPQILDSTGEES